MPSGARTAVAALILCGAIAVHAALAGSAGAGQAADGRWCPEAQAREFDFWIGSWDVRNLVRATGADPFTETGAATDRVYAVLDGCAIVEHWSGQPFPSAGVIEGYSIRAFDPLNGQWDLVLLWPIQSPPEFVHLTGRFEDGVGNFHHMSTNEQGDTTWQRLTFTDVSEDAFRWHNGISTVGGAAYASTWEMRFRRRPLIATGLLNGPSLTARRCPSGEHRPFDSWLGEWAGTRVLDGDSTGVLMRMDRILGGCAVTASAHAEDGSWASYLVRAFSASSRAWIEYAITSDRIDLVRREGRLSAGELVMTDAPPLTGRWSRTVWRLAGESLEVVDYRYDDGEWEPVAVNRYGRRVP